MLRGSALQPALFLLTSTAVLVLCESVARWRSFVGFCGDCCKGDEPKASLWDTDLFTEVTDLKAEEPSGNAKESNIDTYNLVQAREKEAKSKAGPTGPAKVTATSITRGPKGFGIVFGGAKTEDEAKEFGRGIFILKVKGDSVASQNEHLKHGLQVKSVNGTDLTNAIMPGLKPVIQDAKQDMNFELVENPVLYATYKSRYATPLEYEFQVGEHVAFPAFSQGWGKT